MLNCTRAILGHRGGDDTRTALLRQPDYGRNRRGRVDRFPGAAGSPELQATGAHDDGGIPHQFQCDHGRDRQGSGLRGPAHAHRIGLRLAGCDRQVPRRVHGAKGARRPAAHGAGAASGIRSRRGMERVSFAHAIHRQAEEFPDCLGKDKGPLPAQRASCVGGLRQGVTGPFIH